MKKNNSQMVNPKQEMFSSKLNSLAEAEMKHMKNKENLFFGLLILMAIIKMAAFTNAFLLNN